MSNFDIICNYFSENINDIYISKYLDFDTDGIGIKFYTKDESGVNAVILWDKITNQCVYRMHDKIIGEVSNCLTDDQTLMLTKLYNQHNNYIVNLKTLFSLYIDDNRKYLIRYGNIDLLSFVIDKTTINLELALIVLGSQEESFFFENKIKLNEFKEELNKFTKIVLFKELGWDRDLKGFVL